MAEKEVPEIDAARLRRVAEERLGKRATADPSMMEEPLRLLHELQVHQIELEIQNEELRQAGRDLEAALEKYTDLYDFAPVGYVTLAPDGTIRAANLACSTLLGVERSRLIGRRFGLFVSDDSRAAFADFLEKVFASRVKETFVVPLLKEGKLPLVIRLDACAATSEEECRVALADITEHEMLREAQRIVNEAAEVLRLEQKDAELLYMAHEAALELRVAKEAAVETAKIKSLFFANMSHELRTPMAGILGMLQVTLREELSPASREHVETAFKLSGSLLHILNDILDMSVIEAGKLVIEEQPFSLQGCLSEVTDFISHEVRRKGLDFAVSVAEEIPETVVGDRVRLRQILLNLVGNAVKFTSAGRVEVRVSAGRTASGGRREFTFAVTDTGIGIPDDKKHLLFETFSQVDASHNRNYGGAGLGLSICKELVELLGGTISFESAVGVGSTFSFSVHLGEAGPERIEAVASETAAEAMTSAEGERVPHLLLVEDDPNIRKALGLLLKWANFRLDFAEDGLKAVELCEEGEYDLVLMDIQMPRFNGFEATRAIREKERERGGHTPILAMTAHAFREDEERCLEGGMDYYISKPIDIDKCINLIRHIIRQNPRGATETIS